MADYWYDIKPDPDPEEDRFSVFDEQREDYVSVWDVSRFRRWRRFIEYDWAWKVAGPFYRLRRRVANHFKRCAYCGKRGVGPEVFSNTCSELCSSVLYACKVVDHCKLHLRAPGSKSMTLCGEWIWQGINVGEWEPVNESQRAGEFCSICARAAVKQAQKGK